MKYFNEIFDWSTLQIIIDDCIPVMKDFIKKGDVFDYIIHDTTDIPINVTLTGREIPFIADHMDCDMVIIPQPDNVWELLHTILDLALKLLSSSGRCIVQVSVVHKPCGHGLSTICRDMDHMTTVHKKCFNTI